MKLSRTTVLVALLAFLVGCATRSEIRVRDDGTIVTKESTGFGPANVDQAQTSRCESLRQQWVSAHDRYKQANADAVAAYNAMMAAGGVNADVSYENELNRRVAASNALGEESNRIMAEQKDQGCL